MEQYKLRMQRKNFGTSNRTKKCEKIILSMDEIYHSIFIYGRREFVSITMKAFKVYFFDSVFVHTQQSLICQQTLNPESWNSIDWPTSSSSTSLLLIHFLCRIRRAEMIFGVVHRPDAHNNNQIENTQKLSTVSSSKTESANNYENCEPSSIFLFHSSSVACSMFFRRVVTFFFFFVFVFVFKRNHNNT